MPSDSIYRLLPPRTARTLLLATAIGFGLTASSVAETPSGPGAVFDSVEAAAADALQFAAAHKGDSRREWGGDASADEKSHDDLPILRKTKRQHKGHGFGKGDEKF